MEKITTELEDIKEKYEEMRSAKQEAVRELLTLQEQHKAELRILTNSQIEEANARENLERKLCEIRSEVGNMQRFKFKYKNILTLNFSSKKNITNCSWSACKQRMPPNGVRENESKPKSWPSNEITKRCAMKSAICK